jgi:hypothetical protein
MAELMRRRQLAERELDAARNAGDEEAFLDNFKRIAIINEQIEFRPHLVDRWVDEVIADCRDLDDILERLQATIDTMARQHAITRGDHIAAERAGDALDALRNRLAALLH